MKSTLLVFVLGLCWSSLAAGGAHAQEGERETDLLWIMLDTVSPDFLAAGGGEAMAATPHLDALAARGAMFSEVWSVTPQRRLGMLAQLWSHNPGLISALGGTEETPGAASQCEDRGFRVTGMFGKALLTADGEPVGRFLPVFGFPARGWESSQTDEKLTTRLRLVSESSRDDRLFTFVHLPWTNPPARSHTGVATHPGPGGHWKAALEMSDRQIGGLIEVLAKSEALDRTLIVVSAARGLAALPGDQPLRNDALDRGNLRIPLLIAGPGVKAGRHAAMLRSTDILPTLHDFLKLAPEYSNQGRSFAALLRGETLSEERHAFAEHLPFAGESPESRLQMVANAEWRLLHRPLEHRSTLVEHGDPSGKDQSAAHPELVRKLTAELENEQVTDLACARVWSAGENRFPDISGPEGLVFRSRLLIEQGDPKARETVASLISDGRGDPLEGLSLLLACGEKEDSKVVEPLLSHKDPRVQAMAGAFLAAKGDVQRGVDHAVQGLRDDMPDERLFEILTVLGQSDSPLAKTAIEAYKPKDPSPGFLAYRDLALAKLKDEAARQRLARHLLNTRAGYPIRPFLDALVELDREHAGVVLDILLDTSDLGAEDAMEALTVLRELKHDLAARSVARLVRHPVPAVRAAAGNLLREWNSSAAAALEIESAGTGKTELARTFASLATEPGIVGSPVLPGLRFDLWNARENEGGPQAHGLPLVTGRALDFRINLPGGIYDRAGLAFRISSGAVELEGLTVTVRLNDDEALLKTVELSKQGDFIWWVGELPSGAIDPGTNRVRIRAQREDKKEFEAEAAALVFLPAPGRRLEPLAGIDALFGRNSAAAPVHRDAGMHRVFVQSIGGGTLVVTCASKVLARIDLGNAWPGLTRDLTLPEPLPRDARIELTFEDLPAGARAWALVYTEG